VKSASHHNSTITRVGKSRTPCAFLVTYNRFILSCGFITMSLFPKVGVAFSVERLGINAVAAFAAANGLIWRENSIKDIGIDGQLEYVSGSGFATGRIVALQVKSGPSFFAHEDGESWLFYPEDKHRIYWERFPVPVILVLHKPDTEETFWLDVRQAYRSGAQDKNAGVSVPKAQEFKITSRTKLFDNAGLIGEEFAESLDEVLKQWRFKRDAVIQPIGTSLPAATFTKAVQKESFRQTMHRISADTVQRLADELGVPVEV